MSDDAATASDSPSYSEVRDGLDMPLVEAMKIASEVLSNDCLKAALADSTQLVSEGAALHKALEQTEVS